MKVVSLQSGSNGNCFYVETGSVRLLFDAGISGKQAEERLARHGRDIRDVDALFISHDHSDHTKSLGIFQRKFGMPVYITPRTLKAVNRHQKIGKLDRVRLFSAGSSQAFGDVTVHSVPTPHDAVDGIAFIVEDRQHRVGILTDLGHAFDGLKDVLRSLDAVVIESNYDDQMLETGPYPEHLKQRIKGDGGHLSNEDAAILLKQCGGERLKWACLCHLSEENNQPERARATHQRILGDDFPIHVASRYDVSEIFEL
ncbi:MAG: MBL fold metallo-hydrolase [Mariniblastus sp.]|nr:MBL fold metallo-hydrolase [Mariniblastus sp.]